ncbi:aspartate ammonia-lyase [candidate division KSB1 bacterium 4484_87]|nr:MAG: aspartate ammonia-lyase [candidate division KSB1 bacterium 4484_87]
MKNKQQVILDLKNCPLFGSVSDRVYDAGEFLFHESMPRQGIYWITKGEVEILKGIGDHPVRLTLLGDGTLLGERILLSSEIPHLTSAKTTKETRVIFLPKKYLQRIKTENQPLFEHLARIAGELLAQRLASVKGLTPLEKKVRVEHDLLGERELPANVLYGVQTQRAIENFPITGIPISNFPNLIKSLAMVKKAAALANNELGLLDEEKTSAITQACDEIVDGKYHEFFVVDVLQGGAGTSTNMNANEVIANRALEILGHPYGSYEIIHPNNHVNLSQSTNDAYPTAMRLGLLFALQSLVSAMDELKNSFAVKSNEFADVIKMGRTQLQDAVPMTLGQEFGAFATMIEEDISRVKEAMELLKEINLGATAIGTGLNSPPKYTATVRKFLLKITGLNLKTAANLVEATQDTGAYVQLSGVLKRVAVKLSKISNDLRLLSSGPRAGINEINLPPMQPGSSIMPGKVNPVIPEVVNQIAFEVVGHDVTVTMAAEAGQLQLNVMEPVITFSLFSSINHLRQGCIVLSERCIKGVSANRSHALELVEKSIGLVTALNPYLGYEKSSEVASEALTSGKSVYDIVLEKGYLTKEKLDSILDPEKMVKSED